MTSMLSDEAHANFPLGSEFLELQRSAFEAAAEFTDAFSKTSGEKLPASVHGYGTVLSLMYRVACCAWGCQGGDHQLEWLVGRVVNQAYAAYHLIQCASYDEALMLTRGVGEIANLLWLFQQDSSEQAAWASATRRARLTDYGPMGIRKKLEKFQGMGPPIDEKRYQRLCEIGTHPVPGLAPSHYTGTGRPILSGAVQHVAIYVCTTELAYAVAMCGVPTSAIVMMHQSARQQLFDASMKLVRTLGSFTILNYEELLQKILEGKDVGSRAEDV